MYSKIKYTGKNLLKLKKSIMRAIYKEWPFRLALGLNDMSISIIANADLYSLERNVDIIVNSSLTTDFENLIIF